MRYGLLEEIQEVGAYIFGAAKMPYIWYNQEGDWRKCTPKFEPQKLKSGEETSACTVMAFENTVQIFEKFVYGVEIDYSERFIYLLADIDPERGTDPQITFQTGRQYGMIKNDDLPIPHTLSEYLDKTDITGSHLARGERWKSKYELKHEWVWETRPTNYKELLKDALKTSPLAVSVSAWNFKDEVYVSDQGSVNNHMCTLLYIGDYLHYKDAYCIFDSYERSIKWLHPDHNIRRAKRIWLGKKTISALRRHKSILQVILERLLMKRTLLDVCKANLGIDASPKDLADDEVACAETVTTILKQLYPNVPVITGTWTLWNYLEDPKNGFKKVDTYDPETIILSPTGTGIKGSIGHVGIIMENGLIASNNSYGVHKGKFTQNYTLDTWRERYVNKQGMKIHLYKKV